MQVGTRQTVPLDDTFTRVFRHRRELSGATGTR